MKNRGFSKLTGGLALLLPIVCACLAATPVRSSPEIPNLIGSYIGGYINTTHGDSGTLDMAVTNQFKRKFDGMVQANKNAPEPDPVLTFNRGTLSASNRVNLVARGDGQQVKIKGELNLDTWSIEGTFNLSRGGGKGTFFLVLTP